MIFSSCRRMAPVSTPAPVWPAPAGSMLMVVAMVFV